MRRISSANYARHHRAFAKAMDELQLPATFFQIPWERASLPGVFLQNADHNAPVVLVIGGADTCFEDLFLSTAGRNLLERGYSVARLPDLPGQGNTAAQGLHWPVEAEKTDCRRHRHCWSSASARGLAAWHWWG